VDEFEQLKAELDKQLESTTPNVGIAFSSGLFNEFKNRGWFTLETFGALGTTVFEQHVPAYGRTHFVFPSWAICDFKFIIGNSI
jgi:hypothetical protein